jgi:hypothetical protein
MVAFNHRKGANMLWAVVLILVISWLLALMGGYTMDNFVHILLFFAVVALLIQIEDECNNYGSALTRKRYLKGQLIRRTRKILPRFSILAGQKASQPIVSQQTNREE